MIKESYPDKPVLTAEISPEAAIDRYDNLGAELIALCTKSSEGLALRETPQLRIGERGWFLKFMVFIPERFPYSPQISLFRSEISDRTPELKDYSKPPLPFTHVKRSYFSPGPIFKGGNLDSDNWRKATAELAELENLRDRYTETLFSLSPEKAEQLGFNQQIVKHLEEWIQ
jgi:hypothetical protein